jgi:coenzyme F420-0:L-glutamate ligase / coenzyme F420-1:gamma-L-glutamate ligase
MSSGDLLLRPLRGIPAIVLGDNLAEITLAALEQSGDRLSDGDVLIFTQKIVSKAEGRSFNLSDIVPSPRAIVLAEETKKDARLVELVLRESTEVIRSIPGLLIVVHRLGLILANAGVDRSNAEGHDEVLLLPCDPDASAKGINEEILAKTGRRIGVMIIDSIGRPWRMGTVGTAIGVSGIPALLDLRGRPDLNGRPLESTEIGLADELAAAASLVMGQAAEGTPVILARGVPYGEYSGSAADLLRPKNQDLFR